MVRVGTTSGGRAGIALYVALAAHALLLLVLAQKPVPQYPAGSGIGLGEPGLAIDPADRALATARPVIAGPLPPAQAIALPLQAPPPEPDRAASLDARRAAGAWAGSSAGSSAGQSSAPSTGGGRGGYYARLRAHLARHRQVLPAEWTGVEALVTVALLGDGAVSEVRIAQASGIAAFDAEVLALVLRAAPLPAPPTRRPMRLDIPVTLRDPG